MSEVTPALYGTGNTFDIFHSYLLQRVIECPLHRGGMESTHLETFLWLEFENGACIAEGGPHNFHGQPRSDSSIRPIRSLQITRAQLHMT